MDTQKIGRFRVDAVVEVAGPTRPTWLLPAATPEALAPHRDWLVPHFLDGEGRLRQSVHAFVVRTPDLTVVVEYGESIPEIANALRENITRRIEGMTGLTVTEVNIAVNDLYFPGDEAAAEPARVE